MQAGSKRASPGQQLRRVMGYLGRAAVLHRLGFGAALDRCRGTQWPIFG